VEKYSGNTLEKCLKEASKELNIPLDSLEYEVIKESKGLFKKNVTIRIKNKTSSLKNEINETKNIKKEDAQIKVLQGKIVITDGKEYGKSAKIIPGENVVIKLNGEEIFEATEVFSNTEVEINLMEQESKRYINIEVSKDKMEAYLTIKYMPHIVYALEDQEPANTLTLKTKILKEEFPPKFTQNEIVAYLKDAKVIQGINYAHINKFPEMDEVNNIIIARGEIAIDDLPDVIDIRFNLKKSLSFDSNNQDRIDYKDVCAVESVTPGEVLAVLTKGTKGKDGFDIYGKAIKRKEAKQVTFKAGKGTEFKDDSTIIASMAGKPTLKSGVFEVNEVYEVKSDVDINTGSVKFNGNVKIFGAVKEGMKVEATGDIEVLGGLESALLYSYGNISVIGNILRSTITAGGTDTDKLTLVKLYEDLSWSLNELILATEEVKKFNLLGNNITDGQIIKLLIETKFKSIIKTCEAILLTYKEKNSSNDTIKKNIRYKLLGFTPLTIKHYSEVVNLNGILKNEIKELKSKTSIPVDTALNYCQESEINCSGDIIFQGKGLYQSKLKAGGSIYFKAPSVVRGGTLEAEKEINCKTVGSLGGVATKLWVPKHGHIYAEVAYQNTYFSIGEKEVILDVPSKKVHVYLDQDEFIIMDRFNI